MTRSRSNKKAKKPKPKSIQLQAFINHSSELHDALSDGVITRLSWKLVQANIFSDSTVQFVTNPMLSTPEKATKLVGALINCIKTDEAKFGSILDECHEFLELLPVLDLMITNISELVQNIQVVGEGMTAKSHHKRTLCAKISPRNLCSVFMVITTCIFLIGLGYDKYSQESSILTISEFATNYLLGVQPQDTKSNVQNIPKQLDFVGKEVPLLNTSWPLPSRPNPFVGRTKLINEIVVNLFDSKIYIVGLFGPPAFGKSSLAIHIGHEIISHRSIKVNYADLSEFQLSFDRKLQLNVITKEMQMQTHCDGFDTLSRTVSVDNLLKWAASIEETSVLILDNCDLVFHQWHDEFQELIRQLIKHSRGRLKIMITGQTKILFANNFIPIEVAEFNEVESVSLIRILQPKLNNQVQNEIAKLVGNCPLAIKVAIVLLQTIDSNTLIADLKTNNSINILSSSSFPKEERFNVVMETACKYLDNITKEAAYFLSLFPGSFSKDVLSFSSFKIYHRSVNMLFERSLLERYTVPPAMEVRYKFHKLIKQYFMHKILAEKNNSKDKLKSVFIKTFADYYTSKFFRYFTSSNLSSAEDNHQFLTTEQHNLRYLTSNIVPKSGNFSQEEKIVLVFAYSQGVMPSNQSSIIFDMVLEFVKDNTTKFTEMCAFNDTNTCKNLVSHLVHSVAIGTDTRYSYLPCNIWNRITPEKWILITLSDVSVQKLFDNSLLYCSQADIKSLFSTLMYFFACFLFLQYYQAFLRTCTNTTGCTNGSYIWYLFLVILPFYVYKLTNVYMMPTMLIFLLFLWASVRCIWNTSIFVFLLFFCLSCFNYWWVKILDSVIIYLLSEENKAIVSMRWYLLCICFTPTNSNWIFHKFNSVVCVILPNILTLITATVGIFLALRIARYFYFLVYDYRRDKTTNKTED